MRHLTAMLAAAFIAAALLIGTAHAATITAKAAFHWTVPTTFTSGQAIPSSDAITYEIFQGSSASTMVPLLTGVTGQPVTETVDLSKGSCFDMVSIVNSVMSQPSNVACLNVPNEPTGLSVTVTFTVSTP